MLRSGIWSDTLGIIHDRTIERYYYHFPGSTKEWVTSFKWRFSRISFASLSGSRDRRQGSKVIILLWLFLFFRGVGVEFSVVSSCPDRNERKTVKPDSFESKKFCIKVRSDVDISAGVGEIQVLLYLPR